MYWALSENTCSACYCHLIGSRVMNLELMYIVCPVAVYYNTLFRLSPYFLQYFSCAARVVWFVRIVYFLPLSSGCTNYFALWNLLTESDAGVGGSSLDLHFCSRVFICIWRSPSSLYDARCPLAESDVSSHYFLWPQSPRSHSKQVKSPENPS